jgi:hypothetical protein
MISGGEIVVCIMMDLGGYTSFVSCAPRQTISVSENLRSPPALPKRHALFDQSSNDISNSIIVLRVHATGQHARCSTGDRFETQAVCSGRLAPGSLEPSVLQERSRLGYSRLRGSVLLPMDNVPGEELGFHQLETWTGHTAGIECGE